MKKTLYSLAIIAVLVAGISLSGCQTRLQTSEEIAAQAKIDSAKQDLLAAQETATAEDWEAFKTESEVKIRINELSIADLKDRMYESGKKDDVLYAENINKLEKQNESLKARIKNHDNAENRKEKWETFKSEFNHDMDELGQALKDLTVKNTK
jgi:outer membrane murein-binding lipoprotein Lpp